MQIFIRHKLKTHKNLHSNSRRNGKQIDFITQITGHLDYNDDKNSSNNDNKYNRRNAT